MTSPIKRRNKKGNAMSEYMCYLITVLYENELLRCALKVKRHYGEKYPMEQDARDRLHKLLPFHVQECGKIVDVQEIFEIHLYNEQHNRNTHDTTRNTI